MKCVPPDGRFIPTTTGRPAATCARIHAGDGPNTITNGCPGIDSAALSISPRPVNHPACPAIETGVTPEKPKCEYTIARSEMRQPIFQTGIVPTTGADAHRLSRWLKYAPHVSPAAVREQRQAERDVLVGPGLARRQRRRFADRVNTTPTVEDVQVVLVVERRRHTRRHGA